MTDYSEKLSQGALDKVGGATAILFGLLTSAHLGVLTPLIERITAFLTTTSIIGPFSVSYALAISGILIVSAKGANSLFGDMKGGGLDMEFILLAGLTLFMAMPSVMSWASGNVIGLVLSALTVFLYAAISRGSGPLSGISQRASGVLG